MAHKITIEYLVYPRGWNPGECPEVFDSFGDAFERAVESGTDSEIMIDAKVTEGNHGHWFSPYSLVINVPVKDYIDEINRMVFGSLVKGE